MEAARQCARHSCVVGLWVVGLGDAQRLRRFVLVIISGPEEAGTGRFSNRSSPPGATLWRLGARRYERAV
jgi:hypothetical protein